jgi:hypothetical protein
MLIQAELNLPGDYSDSIGHMNITGKVPLVLINRRLYAFRFRTTITARYDYSQWNGGSRAYYGSGTVSIRYLQRKPTILGDPAEVTGMVLHDSRDPRYHDCSSYCAGSYLVAINNALREGRIEEALNQALLSVCDRERAFGGYMRLKTPEVLPDWTQPTWADLIGR